MIFRALTAEDIPQAYHLMQHILDHLDLPLYTDLGPKVAHSLVKEAMYKPRFRYGYMNGYALEVNGQIAACAFAYPGAWESLIDGPLEVIVHQHGYPPKAFFNKPETNPTHFYIDSLVTDAAFRRQGCARKLIQNLVTVAETKGFSMIALNCDQDNSAALALYQSLDFQIVTELMIGGKPHFYLVHHTK